MSDRVCRFCQLIKSLVEEASMHPYGDGWAHRECIEKAVKRMKKKNPIGFKE